MQVTTEFVLTELGNALAKSVHRGRFPRLVERLRDEVSTLIIPVSTEMFDRGLAMYDQRSDKWWSLTDCISFVVMRDMGITETLTADRHFEQAGFSVLLK